MKFLLNGLLLGSLVAGFSTVASAEIKVGDSAPSFTAKNQDDKDFSLSQRLGKGWTVLYFYPKAETPGCTTQACAFRDAVKLIRVQNAEVYGISADKVADQKKFHDAHKLNFDLLADPDATIIAKYSVKMPNANYAKRWTFILDPKLIVRSIEADVDPVMNAKDSVQKIAKLQKNQH